MKNTTKNLVIVGLIGTLFGFGVNTLAIGTRQKQTEEKLTESRVIAFLPTPTPNQNLKRGKVSFYDNTYCEKFNPDCITASQEKFDENELTFACGSDIPLGTKAKFYYTGKGNEIRTVIATCNDRGSFGEKYDRMADLSKATFESIAPLSYGVIEVEMEILK